MSLYKTHQKPPILTSNYICSQRAIKRAINLETFFSEKITFKARKKDAFKRNQFSIKNIKLTGNLLKSFVKLKEIEEKVLNRRNSNCIRKRQNAVTNLSVFVKMFPALLLFFSCLRKKSRCLHK